SIASAVNAKATISAPKASTTKAPRRLPELSEWSLDSCVSMGRDPRNVCVPLGTRESGLDAPSSVFVGQILQASGGECACGRRNFPERGSLLPCRHTKVSTKRREPPRARVWKKPHA